MLTNLRYNVGTLVGRPRRERFLDHFPKGGVGAELGVFRGEFTRQLLRKTRPAELHLVDAWWTVYGEHFPDWGPYTDHGKLTTRQAYEEVEQAVARNGGAGITEIHVGDDLEILRGFPDATFDWVYLDTSHMYEHTQAELALLEHKVRRNGIIAGDDWHDDPNHGHHGVAKAVREFCDERGWRLTERDEFAQWMIRRNSVDVH
jgi:hypothetical protein